MSNPKGPPPEVAAATAARMALHAGRRPASHPPAQAATSVDLDDVRAEAAAAERKRILDIMSSPAAQANPALACELAYAQGRPAAEAIETLNVFAKAAAPSQSPSASAAAADKADKSWDAVADQLNAEAGLTTGDRKASATADPWDDVVDQINGNSRR